MKENDDLSRLLRDRLANAEMDIRPGFWEALQSDLAAAEGVAPHRRVMPIAARRWAAAAAVALVLGAAGLLVWQLPRQENIQDALTQTPATDLGVSGKQPANSSPSTTTILPSTHLAADASNNPTAIAADPMPARQPRQTVQGTSGGLGQQGTGLGQQGVGTPSQGATSSWLASPNWKQSSSWPTVWPYTGSQTDDNGQVTVHVTVTITERLQSRGSQATYGYTNFARQHGYAYPWLPPTMLRAGADSQSSMSANTAEGSASDGPTTRKDLTGSGKWSWRVALGTALPRGDYHAPFTIEVAAQRRLNRALAINAGVQYHYLGTCADEGVLATGSTNDTGSASGSTGGNDGLNSSASGTATPADLHILSIPVRLQVLLASTSHLEFYAQLGGSVEKSVNKGWNEDPIRLSLAAGLGLSYRMNDRLALFAEPSVTHHLDTDTQVCSLRTERATNLGLLCGLRMVY